jgi:hypothetical protein
MGVVAQFTTAACVIRRHFCIRGRQKINPTFVYFLTAQRPETILQIIHPAYCPVAQDSGKRQINMDHLSLFLE